MTLPTAIDTAPAPALRARSRRRLWLANLTTLTIACVVALASAETAVRLFVPVRDVGPAFAVFDSVYGRSHKKSFTTTRITPEFTMRITLNAQGFRGPELAFPARNGVLFIGDSYTEGYGVNDGEEFPQLVGEMLSQRYGPMTLVNYGVGNTGNGRWIKLLERDAAKYDPKLVVLEFCDNDFGDNVRERLWAVGNAGELVELPVPVPSTAQRVAMWVDAVPLVSYSRLLSLGREVLSLRSARIAPTASPGHGLNDELTYSIIRRTLEISAQRGWPVVMLTVSVERADRQQRLKALADQANVPVVESPDRSRHPELYYRVDPHWKAAGHRRIAEMLFQQIVESEGKLRLKPHRTAH
jgi:hypothetical protein